MNSVDRARIMGTLCLWVAMLVCVPAMGQTTDFSGEWSERSHEDNWDRRGGGPARPPSVAVLPWATISGLR